MHLARVLRALNKNEEALSLIDDAIGSAELMFGRSIWWANAKIVEADLKRAMGNPDEALTAYREFAKVAAREQFAHLLEAVTSND